MRLRAMTRALVAIVGIVVLIGVALKVPPMPSSVAVQASASAPVVTAAPGTSVTVTSIPALLTKLADNTVTEIVVANGTYVVPDAHSSIGQESGLWIDQRFAGRTRAVLVRAATDGGVTISGGGATGWIGIAFRDGVHDQTWRGFRFANAEPTQTGVIVFGNSGDIVPVPPHHITLLNMTIDKSITSDNPGSGDHAMYFCKAQSPGVHDILIDGYTVDGSGGVNTAVTFFASAAGQPNANNVTIRHMTVTGTRQAVEFWDPTLQNIVIEDSTVSGARESAVRYELGGTVTLRRVTSTGSGQSGFYSSLGTTPPGVTFVAASLH